MTPNVIADGILLAIFRMAMTVGAIGVLFFVAYAMLFELPNLGQRFARKPHELRAFMRRHDNIWIPALVVVVCVLGWWS